MLRRIATVASLFIISHLSIASTLVSEKQVNKTIRKANKIDDSRNHIVNIGFLYTEDLLEQLNRKQLDDYIERQINAANVVLENSALSIQRRVSYVGQYPISNAPERTINSFLSTIYNIEGDKIAKLVDQYGLDYVTILRPHSDQRFCGWAYYDNPYAIMEIGGNCTSATLGAHEWGHNDGADHDIANSSDIPVREHARGYNCAGEGTIMSTSNNWYNRHEFYSSPDIEINGQKCGTSEQADFVRVLNELKDLPGHLGNRNEDREKLAFIRFNDAQEHIVKEGGGLDFIVELVDQNGALITLNETASIEIYPAAGTAQYDIDYEPFTSRVIFQVGENQKKVTLYTKIDDIVEEQESIILGLRYGDIVKAHGERLEILMSDNSDIQSYQFEFGTLSVVAGDDFNLTVIRNGGLDTDESLLLVDQEDVLFKNTQLLTFSKGQARAFMTFSTSALRSKSTRLEIKDAITEKTYDQILINIVKKDSASTSSGGNFHIIFILSLIILRTIRG